VWAVATNSPDAVTVASRWPHDIRWRPDGDLWLGNALWSSGDRGRAIPVLQRVVARDAGCSTPRKRDSVRQRLPCRACDALLLVIRAYGDGDSLELAERVAADWTHREPANHQAWSALATVYEMQGHPDQALSAQREASSRAGRELVDATYRRAPLDSRRRLQHCRFVCSPTTRRTEMRPVGPTRCGGWRSVSDSKES